jgi:hypothetical protein
MGWTMEATFSVHKEDQAQDLLENKTL